MVPVAALSLVMVLSSPIVVLLAVEYLECLLEADGGECDGLPVRGGGGEQLLLGRGLRGLVFLGHDDVPFDDLDGLADCLTQARAPRCGIAAEFEAREVVAERLLGDDVQDGDLIGIAQGVELLAVKVVQTALVVKLQDAFHLVLLIGCVGFAGYRLLVFRTQVAERCGGLRHDSRVLRGAHVLGDDGDAGSCGSVLGDDCHVSVGVRRLLAPDGHVALLRGAACGDALERLTLPRGGREAHVERARETLVEAACSGMRLAQGRAQHLDAVGREQVPALRAVSAVEVTPSAVVPGQPCVECAHIDYLPFDGYEKPRSRKGIRGFGKMVYRGNSESVSVEPVDARGQVDIHGLA
nr:MAG TPA: hypothetical protein [Caudoviricetes sp.]